MWWPAIGAVFIGVGGVIEPRVLGVGYDTIHSLLRGELVGAVVIGLLVAKALVWSIALGSGTSGGVLAPLLIMGGALGALVGSWIPVGDAGLWALIGMAAMMGGTMRSPLTAMVFAVELTRDFNLFPALLVGSVAALGVTVLLMRRSILTEKLARRGHHITREYSIDPFEFARVRDVMDQRRTDGSGDDEAFRTFRPHREWRCQSQPSAGNSDHGRDKTNSLASSRAATSSAHCGKTKRRK